MTSSRCRRRMIPNLFWYQFNQSSSTATVPKIEEDLFSTTIKAVDGIKGNQVIRDLVDITELYSFQEKLPTMADIFIGLIKADGDEALRKHLQEV